MSTNAAINLGSDLCFFLNKLTIRLLWNVIKDFFSFFGFQLNDTIYEQNEDNQSTANVSSLLDKRKQMLALEIEKAQCERLNQTNSGISCSYFQFIT